MIDMPIGRAKVERMRMEIRADGKPSQTLLKWWQQMASILI